MNAQATLFGFPVVESDDVPTIDIRFGSLDELVVLRTCDHDTNPKRWAPTVTTWPGETFERLTWTCANCGHVRGRA